jgi:hypothetical protein
MRDERREMEMREWRSTEGLSPGEATAAESAAAAPVSAASPAPPSRGVPYSSPSSPLVPSALDLRSRSQSKMPSSSKPERSKRSRKILLRYLPQEDQPARRKKEMRNMEDL